MWETELMGAIQAFPCNEPLLTTKEGLRARGTGPRFMKAGPGMRSRVLYRSTDIHDWMAQRQYLSTSEYVG